MTEQSTFARRVRAARPGATKYEIRDDVVTGLALAIQPTGVRTFFLARMVRGRRRRATIGSADAMTIPEARREARRLIASYIEPARTDNGPRTPGHPMDAFAAEVPRTPGPALETRDAGVQRLPDAQGNPARLRPSHRGRHRGRARQGLVRLHGRQARRRQPRHAGAVHDDAHGRALGIPPPQLQPVQEHPAVQDEADGAVSDGGGNGPAQRRADPRRVLVPERRRHRPAADADRLPLRRDRFPRMGLDQGQAHPPSRLEVRAAHGLAVERRAGRDRRHPAIQRGLPVSFSRPSAIAAHRHDSTPVGPHPRRGGPARIETPRFAP